MSCGIKVPLVGAIELLGKAMVEAMEAVVNFKKEASKSWLPIRKRTLVVLLLVAIVAALFSVWFTCFRMPGRSYDPASDTALGGQEQQEADKEQDDEESVAEQLKTHIVHLADCLLYTSPSPRDRQKSRMPSSA